MADRSRGLVPEDEMFMNKPAEDCDSPTVEPLRIFKPHSPDPAADKASGRFKYPMPPSSASGSSQTKISFPLPPGASSSAQPLPYPEDDDTRFTQPSKPTRPPYAEDNRRPSAASVSRIQTSSPHSASSHSSGGFNDTSPRLGLSPIDNKKPGLAERRGTIPQALSPSSPDDDKDGLFVRPVNTRPEQKINTSYQKKAYYPPPGGAAAPGAASNAGRQNSSGSIPIAMPQPDSSVNRFPSTSTTRASRGSPPPPETPIVEPGNIPGGGIEARYAAAGISGTATLNALSGAAAQRLAQYGGQAPPAAARPARPWTPTETPDQQPHGPPTVYQGSEPVSSPPAAAAQRPSLPQSSSSQGALQVSILEQDFQRMQASTPPPAYDTVQPSGSSSSYPNEKQRPQAQPAPGSHPAHAPPAATASAATTSAAAVAPAATPAASSSAPEKKQQPQNVANPLASPTALQGHPAFANDPRPESVHNGQPGLSHTPSVLHGAAGPASPPPLPEGWISHLDQNSGQYYYIHLATQATQWEFPKGPNPIHVDATPLSPTASTYGNPMASPFLGGKQAMASPGLYPPTPGYAESIMSVAASATPSAAGFHGPPPSAGVDMYKVAPTNGVYFGPYLRYTNMDVERGIWLGSIMIVTDAPQPPTLHIHPSNDLSPNPRQLMPHVIFTHQRWSFHKYEVDLPMSEQGTERWTYAVTSHLGCTRYEFVVAGKHETGWRFIAHSNNDFAPSTTQNDRAKLGGVGFMWKDVLQKNVDCGGFHVQLGLGDQIYGDRLWKEVPLLKQWLAMQGRENRKNVQWTARHEEDVNHAYFHYYTSHFDQPFLREAFAQIPHILQVDDHDIFDGFGSYPDYMQQSAMFKNIGRIAVEMYLLFQHHTTVEILRNVSSDLDLFTITGAGWHFVKYLGPAVVVVGPDCRSERTQSCVLAGPTYQGIFPKVAMLPPSVQHCLWMMSVPLIYPRLETVETLANTFQTGKKAVNTTYNILGKVAGSVAGVVGGREVVQQGFSQVKKAVGKGGLMGNVLNQFGDFDLTEELRDLWTHDSKDLERTYLIRTLQGISQQKGIRMTFLSGDVTCCGAGLVHDPSHPSDHKTMYQIISSPIVAAPPGNYLLKVLHNNRMLYVPANGHKSTHEISDTKEDMMEIFQVDASGAPRELKKLMGRRNYVAIVAYDPETVAGGSQYAPSMINGQAGMGQQQGLSKLSLAVDFVVQGDGAFTTPTKYGPVIVPNLEFGH